MKRKPKTRSSEDTRQRLLDAGRCCFARLGLHGASVHEIAKRAEVTAAMINHHFGGKQGLYRACIGDFGQRRLAVLDKVLVTPVSRDEFVTRVHLAVAELFDLHLDHPDVVRILLRDVQTSEGWGEELERLLFGFSQKLGDYFTAAHRRGFLRKDVDPRTAASVLYLSLSGFVQSREHWRRMSGVDLDTPAVRADLLARVLDVVLRGALP